MCARRGRSADTGEATGKPLISIPADAWLHFLPASLHAHGWAQNRSRCVWVVLFPVLLFRHFRREACLGCSTRNSKTVLSRNWEPAPNSLPWGGRGIGPSLHLRLLVPPLPPSLPPAGEFTLVTALALAKGGPKTATCILGDDGM